VNAPLRRVSVALLVLLGLLLGNLTYVQFFRNDYYRNHPDNRRVQLQEYQRQRGNIIVDNQAIATSVDTGEDQELRFQRYYPQGELYAHIVGYNSLNYGLTGLEAQYDEILSGDDDRLFVRRVSDIITGRRPVGGDVYLTISGAAQQVAYNELLEDGGLGGRGAVVALDPTTGAILALVSTPSFDPNPLVSHNIAEEEEAWNRYQSDELDPMLNRALSDNYPPGSTFKIVVSAAALATGQYTPESMLPAGPSFTPEQTTVEIRNSTPSTCPEAQVSFIEAVTVSCNTAFARLGTELGADAVQDMARRFGFEDDSLRIPLPVAASHTGDMPDPPALAQSCIGQRDVRMTPLQGAMIAAAVANGGRLMRPYLVDRVTGPPGVGTLEVTEPEEYGRPLTESQAEDLREMMISVVDNGTGRRAAIDGVTVGGKTGTAQNAAEANTHGWFIGFALEDGQPRVAVAVFLDRYGDGGSGRAAEIAGHVMRAVLDAR